MRPKTVLYFTAWLLPRRYCLQSIAQFHNESNGEWALTQVGHKNYARSAHSLFLAAKNKHTKKTNQLFGLKIYIPSDTRNNGTGTKNIFSSIIRLFTLEAIMTHLINGICQNHISKHYDLLMIPMSWAVNSLLFSIRITCLMCLIYRITRPYSIPKISTQQAAFDRAETKIIPLTRQQTHLI